MRHTGGTWQSNRGDGERAIAVTALKHAIPYIQMFKGKTFVIKAGGAIFTDKDRTRALMEQVGILHQVGIRTVMVHGGGPQSTELAAELGIEKIGRASCRERV